MNCYLFRITILLFFLILSSCQEPAAGPLDNDLEAPAESSAEQADTLEPTATAKPTTMPSAKWQIIKELQPEHQPKYAAFMNELFGVTGCGTNIQPSFTADGGQTWNQPVMGQFCPDSVDIVDGRSIWLCNSFGVFTSKDGGRSLTQMYSPYDGCRILSFADDQHGWSSFDWNLAATSDGALRWVDVEKDFTMGDIAALNLRTPQEGYVLTYNGILFVTNNAGESWTPIDLELVSDEMRIANFDGRPPASVQFQDAENGIIILAMAGRGNTQFLALHTDDGGQNWKRHDLPLNLGPVYLSRDGRFLTVTELGGAGGITILENQGLAD